MVPFTLTSRDGITNSAGRSGFEFHELCRKGCTTLQERLSGCHHGLVAERHAEVSVVAEACPRTMHVGELLQKTQSDNLSLLWDWN